MLILIYLLVGLVFFPDWWFSFFYKGGFKDFREVLWNLAGVFWFILAQTPFGIPLLLVAAFLAVVGRMPNTILFARLSPIYRFSIFSKRRFWLPASFLALSLVLVVTLPAAAFKPQDEQPKKAERFLTPPVDFSYVNDAKVLGLYSQISADLKLTAVEMENSSSRNASASAGTEALKMTGEVADSKVRREKYAAKDRTTESIAVELLNYLHEKELLKAFENRDFSSEEVKDLNELKRIADLYKIGYDSRQYDKAYFETARKAFINKRDSLLQTSEFLTINGQVLLKEKDGEPTFEFKYFDRYGFRMTFWVSLHVEPGYLRSSLLTEPSSVGKEYPLSMFLKQLRIETTERELTIYCEAYAIW
jgi:hypothetical protein